MNNKHHLLLVAAILMNGSAILADEAPSERCSNETLKGDYAVAITGMVPAPSVLPQFFLPPGTPEQIIGFALQTFDGKGSYTQIDNVKGSLSGIVQDRPGRGTYSVNANCTGTYTISRPDPLPPLVVRFVLSDGGKQFTAVVVFPQASMTVATGRKQ